MKRAFKTFFVLLVGLCGIGGVALLAHRFQNHSLFAPTVYVAIVAMLGVFYWLFRRTQRQADPGKGG